MTSGGSVVGQGFLMSSLEKGGKMQLNMVWHRVRLSESQRHSATEKLQSTFQRLQDVPIPQYPRMRIARDGK